MKTNFIMPFFLSSLSLLTFDGFKAGSRIDGRRGGGAKTGFGAGVTSRHGAAGRGVVVVVVSVSLSGAGVVRSHGAAGRGVVVVVVVVVVFLLRGGSSGSGGRGCSGSSGSGDIALFFDGGGGGSGGADSDLFHEVVGGGKRAADGVVLTGDGSAAGDIITMSFNC